MVENSAVTKGMERQLETRAALLAAGAKALGWKVGFGAPAALEMLGIDGPLVGFLVDGGLIRAGETVSLAGWTKPVAEPEIAIYMGSDLAGGAGPEAAAAAIAGLGPAIELADMDEPPKDAEAILAGNIYHRRVALCPMDETRAGARLDSLSGRVFRHGGEFAFTEELEANTGKLIEIVAHVADTLAACGEALRAGEVIIPGSVTPPIFLDAGDAEVRFELEPAGSISVNLR
jgi:2-keto-4-pentenoate hydratase